MTDPEPVTSVEGTAEKLGKNAAVISGITLLARIAGFGRILVLTWALGMGGVLDVYNTANRIPNIIYEIVAGGALAALVVPLLAAPLARREPVVVNRTAAGLLTWSLVILVPMAAVVAVLAEPIMVILHGGHGSSQEIAMGARMIRVFAPQLPLYGIGVVLTGILHTHRRFAWPALAPLLSSLTVIAAYVGYGLATQQGTPVGEVSLPHELILSLGTTFATVVMTFCLLIPLRRVGMRLRPTLRFGSEVSKQVRSMAVAGGISIAAWQLSLLLILGLTNAGLRGTVGLFTIALTLYMLPWGVFAMPLSLSSYPALSEAYGTGDETKYKATLSVTTRRVLLLASLGSAALIGLAVPLAAIFAGVGGSSDVDPRLSVVPALSQALMALAPGLLGFSLYPLLTRALYARTATTAAAVATVCGWLVAYVAAIGLALLMPVADRAVAVGIGNSIGMFVVGAALLATIARHAGKAALSGAGWAAMVGVVSAALSAVAGRAVTALWGTGPSLSESVMALLAGGCAIVVVFSVVSYVIDKRDVRPLAAAALSRIRHKRT